MGLAVHSFLAQPQAVVDFRGLQGTFIDHRLRLCQSLASALLSGLVGVKSGISEAWHEGHLPRMHVSLPRSTVYTR